LANMDAGLGCHLLTPASLTLGISSPTRSCQTGATKLQIH